MTIVTVTRTPIFGGTPSPWQPFTIVGGSTVHAVLSDSNDGTYIESGGNLVTVRNQLMYAIFAPLNLPTGAIIEYIQPVVRERHGAGGWLTVAELHARNAAGQHKTAWSLSAIGTQPADNVWRTAQGPIFAKAADGTAWSDCDPTTFTAVLAWGPRWFDTYFNSISVKPAMARLELLVAYRLPPTTVINAPTTGPVTDPRPNVEWETGQTQEAYRIVVVPTTATDASGRTAGSVSFDPSTVTNPPWDSGKVYSALTQAVVTSHLTPGVSYLYYTRTWAPSIGDTEMPSPWTFVGPYSVQASSVAAPTIDMAEHDATASVQITVTRVVPAGVEATPTYFALERWNETTGAWDPVQGAQRFSGPGPWSYFDSTRSASETVLYRARGVFITSTNSEIPSAWVSDSLVVANRGEWWLKDPIDAFLNRRIDVADYSETIPKPQEVAYGAGAHGATVTHQGVRAGQHRVRVRTLDKATYDDVRALLDSGRSLILSSVFGDAWRVQLADNAEVTIVRAAPTAGETTPIRAARVLQLTFIEVER